MQPELAYYYHWELLSPEMFPRIVREFLDHGADRFVFTDALVRRALAEPEFLDFLRKLCRELRVSFVAMHAPFGPDCDLNIPHGRERMIATQLRALEIAAEFGAQTCTVHVGAYHHCVEHLSLDGLRQNASAALDRLVPEAERTGVILAVENSYEPPNSAREIRRLIAPYLSSSAIGVCYDTGHARIMSPAPWKAPEQYAPYVRKSWWEHGIQEEADSLELLHSRIVAAHMHDNDGYADLHAMPGDGTIDWTKLPAQLRSCPRMREFQTEVNLTGGANWAGLSPAPPGGYSIKRLVETFRELGF